jgi:hypothetical protein
MSVNGIIRLILACAVCLSAALVVIVLLWAAIVMTISFFLRGIEAGGRACLSRTSSGFPCHGVERLDLAPEPLRGALELRL